MIIREHIDEGRCYPADADSCRSALLALHETARVEAREAVASLPKGASPIGGLIPHGQWSSCASTAACVLQMLASSRSPDVVVMFGGAARNRGKQAALFGGGRWTTPIGRVSVATRLAERVLSHTNLIVDDPYAHESEDSLEVQMPLIQQIFSGSTVLPIIVPNSDDAAEVGRAIGRTLNAYRYNAVVIGTANVSVDEDSALVDLVCTMRSNKLEQGRGTLATPCHSGATAATIATSAALGATAGVPTSQLTKGECHGDGEANGKEDLYAGIIFI